MGQVRHHQESTERQYALKHKALKLGWNPSLIRILDRDLGKSGAHASGRKDFKTLVADVSMGEVGALFCLEASRLARSNLDWQRLIELCALTGTIVIDEDGCYDPANFNDGLLLGLKGTIAQAELHFIRARLQGGKINKAKKGELRFPLPVGYCYDDQRQIVIDPDQEIQGAVRMVFDLFHKTGSTYGVVQEFSRQGLLFPKRAYGGVWNGKVIWDRLSDTRVGNIIKNPSYAGVYTYGKQKSIKVISPDGEVKSRTKKMPMDEWLVTIKGHHEGYITYDDFVRNKKILEKNRTNREDSILSGPAREGMALLQGLLVCGGCGRKISIRYQGNNGIYPTYECNWKKRHGLSTTSCITTRCDPLDEAISKRILEVIKPEQIELAYKAVQELENRDKTISKQWEMRVERAKYETSLAEKRYLEVDPTNRLVAATLEQRWNLALTKLEEVKKEFNEFKKQELYVATPEHKKQILKLAKSFPRLWNAKSTKIKDKKRMLRLLIKDITVEKVPKKKQVILHISWQGGVFEDLVVDTIPPIADRLRYPEKIVDKVRKLSQTSIDEQIAHTLNNEGHLSATGKPFNISMIKWIRHKHHIPVYNPKRADELTVREVSEKFDVSPHVVYYWINNGVVKARQQKKGRPHWLTIDCQKQKELSQWVQNSSRIIKTK